MAEYGAWDEGRGVFECIVMEGGAGVVDDPLGSGM